MEIRKTEGGGRIVEGNSALGNFRVQWDAAGKLIREFIQLREPTDPADECGDCPGPDPRDVAGSTPT